MNYTPSPLDPSTDPETLAGINPSGTTPQDAPGTTPADSPAGLDAGTPRLPWGEKCDREGCNNSSIDPSDGVNRALCGACAGTLDPDSTDDAPDIAMVSKRFAGEYLGDATYDPRDNKLRIYAFARLPREVYERIRAAGFQWAPKQELFVAPAWTPEREDIALELCGDIDDESTTPEERAAFRAERFDGYRENRERDTARAVAYVDSIAEGIPLGQPILVGHHSERHARRDARRIESGMRRAVENWGKAEYWRSRVPAVLAHAEYREAPGVRSRRIKGLAADLRKQSEQLERINAVVRAWRKIAEGVSPFSRKVGELREATTTQEAARYLVGSSYGCGLDYSKWSKGLDDGTLTVDAAAAEALANLDRSALYRARWTTHYANRLAFERAALALEEGRDPDAPAPAAIDYKVGGTVATRASGRHSWSGANDGEVTRRRILRVTKRNGAVLSLVLEGLRDAVAVEACADYQPPTADDVKAAKARTALPPLCNYPAASIPIFSKYRDKPLELPVEEWTAEEYAKLHSDYKGTRHVEATATHGAHRVRSAMSTKNRKPGEYGSHLVAVFITDQKRKDPPAKAPPPPAPEERTEDMDAPKDHHEDPALVDQVLKELGAGVDKDPAGQDFAENPPGWDQVEGGPSPESIERSDAEFARGDVVDLEDLGAPLVEPVVRVATVRSMPDNRIEFGLIRVPLDNALLLRVRWTEALSQGPVPRTVYGDVAGEQWSAYLEEVAPQDVNGYRAEGQPSAACAERFNNCEPFRGLPPSGRFLVDDGSRPGDRRCPTCGYVVNPDPAFRRRGTPGLCCARALNLPQFVGQPERGTAAEDSSEGRDDFREGLAERVDQMRATLEGGVRVVSAPNLFPTPPQVALEMVDLARLYTAPADLRVLEPSAGTGRLLDAMRQVWPKWFPTWTVHAVEVNRELAGQLQARFPGVTVHGADFLSFAAGQDFNGGAFVPFDRILMNPPFDHGSDVEHVRHALRFLRPGGTLVGICANGPKQYRDLEPMTDYWEELPSGTFSGTKVGAVLFRVTLGQDGKPVPE